VIIIDVKNNLRVLRIALVLDIEARKSIGHQGKHEANANAFLDALN
jgi:hypothetical protein